MCVYSFDYIVYLKLNNIIKYYYILILYCPEASR